MFVSKCVLITVDTEESREVLLCRVSKPVLGIMKFILTKKTASQQPCNNAVISPGIQGHSFLRGISRDPQLHQPGMAPTRYTSSITHAQTSQRAYICVAGNKATQKTSEVLYVKEMEFAPGSVTLALTIVGVVATAIVLYRLASIYILRTKMLIKVAHWCYSGS